MNSRRKIKNINVSVKEEVFCFGDHWFTILHARTQTGCSKISSDLHYLEEISVCMWVTRKFQFVWV